MVESLGAEGHLGAVAGHKGASEILFGHVAYHLYPVEIAHLVVEVKGHGEEEFVVFAAIEGCGDKVHAYLFGHDRSLVVDGYAVFIHAAAAVGCFTEMKQFRRKTVADIDHGSGADPFAGEDLHNISSGFGLELPFDKIFLAFKSRHEVLLSGRCHLFAFEELEAHIGSTEVARYAYEVGVFGTVASCGFASGHVPMAVTAITRPERDEVVSPPTRSTCRSRRPKRMPAYSSSICSTVNWLDTARPTVICRDTVHGAYIGEVDNHRFVAEMAERYISQVKMYTFDKEIGGNEGVGVVGVAYDCGIVARQSVWSMAGGAASQR